MSERDAFPSGSQLAVYAVRHFDGDTDADQLHDLLYEVGRLVERVNGAPTDHEADPPAPTRQPYSS